MPTNGGTSLVSASQQVTIYWTAASRADEYDIELYPEGTNCSHANADCLTQTGTSYTFTPAANVSRYTFRVRPVNTDCGNYNGSWSNSSTFSLTGQISGTFYQDTSGAATLVGGICSLSSATPTPPGTGAAIGAETRDGTSQNGTIAGSAFTITVPYWPTTSTPNNIVTLNPGELSPGVQYQCSCPIGCQYSGIASPQSGVNFFVRSSALASGWWQVIGGNSQAGADTGAAIVSAVPTATCTASNSCVARINRKDLAETPDSAGIALTGGGEIDSTYEAGYQTTHVTDRAAQVVARGTKTTRFQETYDYFYRQYSMGAHPETSDDFTATAADAPKPDTRSNEAILIIVDTKDRSRCGGINVGFHLFGGCIGIKHVGGSLKLDHESAVKQQLQFIGNIRGRPLGLLQSVMIEEQIDLNRIGFDEERVVACVKHWLIIDVFPGVINPLRDIRNDNFDFRNRSMGVGGLDIVFEKCQFLFG